MDLSDTTDKIKSYYSKLKNWLNLSSTNNFIWLVCSCIFALSFWLISRNNGYFSGDMAIIGTITKDFSSGKFYSWYFYGQSYFGNLEPMFLAIVTRITGNSINSLYFWEHFWYYLSLLLIFITIPKLKNWQTILAILSFFFAVRYYDYTYYPQGFAFTLLIIISFYALFQKVYSEQIKFASWQFALVGFITTVSIWFNPTVAIIFPIFLIIYGYHVYLKKETLNYVHFVWGFFGLALGIIPFALAYFQGDGYNLKWFSTNKSSDIIANLRYYGIDLLYFFVSEKSLKFGNTTEILKSTFLNLRNILGIFSSLLILGVTISSFKFWKENLVAILFLLFSSLLLLNKDLGPNTFLFDKIRYAIPTFTFILILVFSSMSIFYSKYKTELGNPKVFKVLTVITSIVLLGMTIISISKINSLYRNPNREPQLYEVIANKLIYKYETKNLFCDNFYDLCMGISYVNKDKNFTVEVISTADRDSLRNPGSIGKVEAAYKKGEIVYSLVREDKLSPSCKIEEVFAYSSSSTKYYLVKGKYSEC